MSMSPENDFQENRPPPRRDTGGESPFGLMLSGVLFLYVGFGLGLVGVSGDALYDGSIVALVWTARVVGIGLLALSGLTLLRLPFVTPLNLLFSALASLGCLIPGAIWLVHGDMQGVLLCIFGLWNGAATINIWRAWKAR